MGADNDVIVLGGGFAGLCSAAILANKGKKVIVLEKKPHLGGRAFSFIEPVNGQMVDNGQHLFMGCYHATRKFLKLIGTDPLLEIYPKVLVDYVEPGAKRDRLSCPTWLPVPLHLAIGLMNLKRVSLKEKMALISFDQALNAMRHGPIPPEVEKMTVRQWLNSLGISRNFQTRFFDPAAIGILNESPEISSVAGFIQALREMFLRDKESSYFALPKTGLTPLYQDAAKKFIESRGGQVMTGQKVAGLLEENDRVVGVHIEGGEKIFAKNTISTLPPWNLGKLNIPLGLRGDWEKLQPSPIVSVTLWLDRPFMTERFMGLINTDTHWVFNKTLIEGLPGPGQTVAVVISAAHKFIELTPEQILQIVLKDLLNCFPQFAGAKVLHKKVVKEPFATLSAVPGAENIRPVPGQAMPGFWFAGDWTRTGYPATIESACVSAELVAKQLLQTPIESSHAAL